jgi:YVTN family beta-propeller protein
VLFPLALLLQLLCILPAAAQVAAGTLTLPAGTQPGAIAVNPANGKIYVANLNGNTLYVIDGQTPLATPASIALPTGSLLGSLVVNPVTGTVYADNGTGAVLVINGTTNAVTTLPLAARTTTLAVNAATGTTYAASTDGTVTAIAGTTNATTQILPPSSTGPSAVAVNSVTNRVYIANKTAGTVSVINGATATVIATVTVGTKPVALLANPITNKIYVVNAGSNSVSVLDGASNTVTATVTAGTQPSALALNAVTGQVYVANSSPTVTQIDGATNHPSTIAVGTAPVSIAIDAGLNLIYVADSGSNDVAVIAGATAAVTRVTTGQDSAAVAVNPITHDAFVTNAGSLSHSVTLLTASGANVKQISNVSPFAVLLNPATQQYFIQSGGAVTILSALTNTVQATVQLLYGGNNYSNYYLGGAMDLNPLTDKLYVANQGFGPGSSNSNVTVIDGQAFTATSIAVGNFPHAVVVNPITGKVYMTSPGTGTMTVIDGATNTAKTVYTTSNQTDGQPWSLAINPVTDTIYVGNQQTENIAVFNGDADFLIGSIPTTSYSNQLLVDPASNRIYSLNEYVLQVIDGKTDTTVGSLTPCYLPRAMSLNAALGKLYIANCEDYSYTVVNTATLAFTNYPGTSGVFQTAIVPNPATGQAYLASTLSYGSTAADQNIFVLDGGTDAVSQIPAAAQCYFALVNPRDSSVYLGVYAVDNTGDPLLPGGVLLTKPASVPLLPTLTPVHDARTVTNALIFETGNRTPAFTATVAGAYTSLPVYAGLSPSNPVATELYYSIDGGELWSLATPVTGTPGAFTIQPTTALLYGPHTLYAYAAYGTEGGSSSAGQSGISGNTPELGDIVGYPFYIVPALPATTTTLTASPNPQAYNQPVAITVQVASTTAGTFTGQFVILDGTTTVQYGLTPDSTGKATYTSPILATTAGTHTLTATYYGDPNYASSTSAPYSEVISGPLPATTLSLAATPNPQFVGGTVTLTATVASATAGTFTGKVAFTDGGTTLASGVAPNASGVATFTASTLTVGTHTLAATYAGDPNYAGSSSNTVIETINAAPTFTVASSPGTLTVSAGGTGSTSLNVTPVNGFAGTVALTCTGAPANSTCVIAPTSVSVASATAATATLTLTAHSLQAADRIHPPIAPRIAPMEYALLLLPFSALLAIPSRKRRSTWQTWTLPALLFTAALAFSGCGGGGTGPAAPINTTPGSYTLQITATSGTITATTTIALTIQ